ncbi:hypothetical protein BD770DRAFT_389718 [Pilaira anomala]|nr:hypothetical protein BD770DRAFT_389718 [Pilaira anomala]
MFVILSRKKVSLLSLLLLSLCVLLWLAVVNPILHRVCLDYKFVPPFPFLLSRSRLLLKPFLLFFRLLGTIPSTLSSLSGPALNLLLQQ